MHDNIQYEPSKFFKSDNFISSFTSSWLLLFSYSLSSSSSSLSNNDVSDISDYYFYKLISYAIISF